ncbi:MAG: DUF2844 domain-containing protein [Syntrophales bacterium]|jgi:hypothetical protein
MVIQTIMSRVTLGVLWVVMAHVVLLSPSPASAALGGYETTVQADQARMKGTLRSTPTKAYTVHEIKAQTGTVVREYVSPAGKIFAVVWQGPFLPDLRQVLGSYFEQFSQSAQKLKSEHPQVRRRLLIQEPGLVVQTGGHMRAYFGRAYVPELVPQGVRIEEIQ